MAKTSKSRLKLFRTEIGFHDAFVAAPSMKAALAAWGASTDLFSAGLAERIDDAKRCPAAFDAPGEVVTVRRGSEGEWTRKAPRPAAASSARKRAEAARARLERRLASLDQRHATSVAALDRQARALEDKRARLEAAHGAERRRLLDELAAVER